MCSILQASDVLRAVITPGRSLSMSVISNSYYLSHFQLMAVCGGSSPVLLFIFIWAVHAQVLNLNWFNNRLALVIRIARRHWRWHVLHLLRCQEAPALRREWSDFTDGPVFFLFNEINWLARRHRAITGESDAGSSEEELQRSLQVQPQRPRRDCASASSSAVRHSSLSRPKNTPENALGCRGGLVRHGGKVRIWHA